jgi:hypothetical protein
MIMASAVVLTWAGYCPVMAEEILKGSIIKQVEPQGDMLEGEVRDAHTRQPIPDAEVTLPDSGYSVKTDRQGHYQIPRNLGQAPIIMSIQKPGYAPFSVSISHHSPPRFSVYLERHAQMLVLDDRLRHLGDNSYSHISSNAGQFRKPTDGPALRYRFSLDGMTVGTRPTLYIGSIIGLDTPMAHLISRNPMDVSTSPLVVRLNGTMIAQVQVNGDGQRLDLPRHLLHETGFNILELETGSHLVDEGERLDYDDMELMHLVLYP